MIYPDRRPWITVLYVFDHRARPEELRTRPFLDRKAALARLVRDTGAGILLSEHLAEDGPPHLIDTEHRPDR
jgi:ATP-dependent DNA ligase